MRPTKFVFCYAITANYISCLETQLVHGVKERASCRPIQQSGRTLKILHWKIPTLHFCIKVCLKSERSWASPIAQSRLTFIMSKRQRVGELQKVAIEKFIANWKNRALRLLW